MAGVIKAVIFLAIIGGVIFGAKTFYFDPAKQEQQLADMKSELRKQMDAGENDKALATCDKLQKRDPKLKKFCNGRRYEIYKDIGEKACMASMNEKDMDTLLTLTETVIDAVENIEKYGQLTRVHQGWLMSAYGDRVTRLGLAEEKPKLKAAQARQKELPAKADD